MDTKTDDNFFIEEPQKLLNSFFNKDKSMQIVELLAQKHHDIKSTPTTTNTTISNINNNINESKRIQINRMQQPCRLPYGSSNNKKLQLLHSHPMPIQPIQHASNNMPKSFISRLEILCQALYNSDDIDVAQKAVDTLDSAYRSGCCFLEKYIVVLLNFCTKNHHKLADSDDIDKNDMTMNIKVKEILDRVLIVNFNRQQLTENLRRPEYKLTSVEHIIQLLRRVQDMLDYREQTAVNWLLVILDAYFVELATADEAVDILDQISAHINFQCALMRESESTKCLLKSILEHEQEGDTRSNYSIEYIEI